MNRRNFIRDAGLTASTVSMVMNGSMINILPQSRLHQYINSDNDKVLVLVQLQGGNDGLNTVIPLQFIDLLAKHRSNLYIPENKLLQIDHENSFHPAFSGMKNLYEEGKLNILHSVGYPNQNRSHFRSTDIWSSGSAADDFDSTGWLGKYLDRDYPNYPEAYPNSSAPHPLAITMGGITSETCQGQAANFSLALDDPFSLSPLAQGGHDSQLLDTYYGEELAFIREEIAKTNAYGEVITEAANKGRSFANYPEGNNLAGQLKNVVILLNGGLQTRIFVCSIGGFDTHADQVEEEGAISGVHNALLEEVSSAIASFQSDLAQSGIEERVLGATFSEFGRQIGSNQSLGTDHGTAAPLFLFGSCVQAGFTGHAPDIPERLAPQEGVSMQIDFRDVYGTILHDWFGVDDNAIRNFLFPDFKPLALLSGCQTTTTFNTQQHQHFEIYPNPFHREIEVVFTSSGGHTRISIMDGRGAEVRVALDKRIAAGRHRFRLDLRELPAANYFVNLRSNKGQETKTIMKLSGH